MYVYRRVYVCKLNNNFLSLQILVYRGYEHWNMVVAGTMGYVMHFRQLSSGLENFTKIPIDVNDSALCVSAFGHRSLVS
jgi:hypothetical protein